MWGLGAGKVRGGEGAMLVERMGRGWPGRGEEAEDARGDGAGRSVGVGAKLGMEGGKGLQGNEWVGIPPATWCSAKPREHIQDPANIFNPPAIPKYISC